MGFICRMMGFLCRPQTTYTATPNFLKSAIQSMADLKIWYNQKRSSAKFNGNVTSIMVWLIAHEQGLAVPTGGPGAGVPTHNFVCRKNCIWIISIPTPSPLFLIPPVRDPTQVSFRLPIYGQRSVKICMNLYYDIHSSFIFGKSFHIYPQASWFTVVSMYFSWTYFTKYV